MLAELVRHGVKRIVLVNGHFENVWPSVEEIELALDALGPEPVRNVKDPADRPLGDDPARNPRPQFP